MECIREVDIDKRWKERIRHPSKSSRQIYYSLQSHQPFWLYYTPLCILFIVAGNKLE